MQRTKRTEQICEPDFLQSMEKMLKDEASTKEVLDFIRYFCLLLDTIISTGDAWISIGLGRSTHAPQVVFHEGKVVTYAGGATLADFIADFGGL